MQCTMAASEETLWVATLAAAPAAPAVPWLHERWTWEGDETPLPGKWAALVQGAGGDEDAAWLKAHILASPAWEPASLFFLTHRCGRRETAAKRQRNGSALQRLPTPQKLHRRHGTGVAR